MKNYTDIEQSKKLAGLLPLESADMCWTPFDEKWDAYLGAPNPDAIKKEIPCWSLAALLRLIPNFNIYKRTIECRIETTNHLIDKACDLVDAAFEMVCWLKENNKI